MKEEKRDEFRGHKIVAGSILFAVSVMEVTKAVNEHEDEQAWFFVVLAGLSLLVMIRYWSDSTIWEHVKHLWGKVTYYPESEISEESKKEK